MIWGLPKKVHNWPRQTFLAISPKAGFFVILVLLGLYIPPALSGLLERVAASLEGP
jgi:hypothetical protein